LAEESQTKQDQKNKRDEKEYCESAINKSRVICKEGTRKEYGKESKGEEIT
jgi:hypothetical protein